MVRYYSSFYRKLYKKDSPSGHLLQPIKRHKPRKIKKIKPRTIRKTPVKSILTVTKKAKKTTRVKPLVKRVKLRKAKTGLSLTSRTRRGQLRMRPKDQYESQMVKRLRSGTGMTHVQVMNLVNIAKKSDYIDVETEIASVRGHSKLKPELYEHAKKKILTKLDREIGNKKYELMSTKQIDWEITKYDDMFKDWKTSQRRGKPSLI